MPLYDVRGPNGRIYKVEAPEGTPAEQIKAAARYQYLSDTTPEEDTSGFTAAASAGFKRLYGEAALTAGKAGLIAPERAQQIQKEQEEAAQRRFTPTEKGWTEDPWLKIKELAGGSAPYMVAPLAVGAAAAALPVSAPTAGIIGALGAGAASTAQFTGSNIAAQMEAGKTFEEASGAKAALTAIPQAALDALSLRMVPGLGRLLGAAGKEVTEESARELASQTMKQIALDYTKATGLTMTREGLTEAAQQALERAQAGLSITDEDARKEYFDQFLGGAILGGVLAGPGRAFERGEIKSKGREFEQARLGKEREAAAAEQARIDAETAAAKQTPEYLDNLITQYDTLSKQLAETPVPKKVKNATPEEEAAYDDAKAARDALLDQFKPVRDEYRSRVKDIQARRAEVQAELETGQKAIPGLEAPPVPATDEQQLANLTQQRDLLTQRQAQLDQRLEQTKDQPQAQQGLLQQRTIVQQQLDNVTAALEKVAPPPAQTPMQQRVDLSQQRDALMSNINQIRKQAMEPGLEPQQMRGMLQQAAQLNQAVSTLDKQLKKLGGPVESLDKLQADRDSFVTKLEAAKKAAQKANKTEEAFPAVTKLLGKISEIDEKIALYKPAEGPQATLAFEPTAQERAAEQQARTGRAQQEALEGGAGPMQQLSILGLSEPVLPTRKFEAAPEAAPTAFDTQEEIRKLSMVVERQMERTLQAPIENYKAESQKLQGLRQQLEDLKASAPAMPEAVEQQQTAAVEEQRKAIDAKITKAQEKFNLARNPEVGDIETADKAFKQIERLQAQRAALPETPVKQQVDLEQGAAALHAYETALAEKIAAGREQSVERQRQANIAMAKAKADIQALLGQSEAAPLIQEARVAKQRDIQQQQREIAQFEAEAPGAVTPQLPAVNIQDDLRQTLQDIARYESESPSVFASADDDARATALLDSITQSRKTAEQRAAEALEAAKRVPTRGLPPLNTAVERAAAAEKAAPAPEAKATPVAEKAPPAPAPVTTAAKEKTAAVAQSSKSTFSGKKTVRHTSSKPNLTKFEKNYTGSRYDGYGGTFGKNGVYLDNTGQWTNKNNALFSTANVYDVEANFKKAIVLSPDTVDSFIAALPGPPPRALWGGDALVAALKKQGYDGIIVEGFGGGVDPYADTENKFKTQREKLIRAKVSLDVTQDQVFAFDPNSLTVIKKVRSNAPQTTAEKPAAEKPIVAPGEKPAASLVRDTVEKVEKQMAEEAQAKPSRYAPRPTTPLTDAVREAVEEGRSLDVVKSLLESKNPMIRTLAENMLRMMDSVKRVPKLLVQDNLEHKGEPAEGLYFDKSNRVVMDRASLTEEALAHEYSHAVTLTAIREFQKNPDSAVLTDAQKAAARKLQRLYNNIKEHEAFRREYGKESLEEFVSEVLSNESLRSKLDTHMTGTFKKIITAIMNLLGIDTRSLSSEAFDTALTLFQPPAAVSRNVQSAPVASIVRGKFFDKKPQASAAVPADVVDTVNSIVGKNGNAGGSQTASALGLLVRQKMVDNWASPEALIKKGVAEGKVSYTQALQMRTLMRVHNDTNRLTATAIKNGGLQLAKDKETGALTFNAAKAPGAFEMSAELAKSKLGDAQFVENLFTNWLAILRAERENVGYDKLNLPEKLNSQKAAAIKDLVNSDPATKEAFENARKIYHEYNRNLLDLLVKSGVMSQKKANELIAGDYVPFYRVVDGIAELHVGTKRVTIGSVIDQPQIKELVGGDQQILPVFSSMVQNTSLLITAAVRNMQVRDFGNIMQDMGLAQVIPKAGPKNDIHTARFRYKGEDYHVRLDPDAFPENIPADLVIAGLQGIKTAVPTAVRLMGLPARLLRKGVTRMPTYLVRQLIRDPVHNWLTTGGDFSMVRDTYKEFFSTLKKPTETVKLLEESGAVSSMVQTGDKEDLARVLRDIQSSGGGSKLNSALSWLDQKAMDVDAATRAAVYNEFRKKGAPHLEALLAAAEAMNFSRRGTSTSMYWMSAMVPFFNAQVQGIDSVYRAFKGDTAFEGRMDAANKLRKRLVLMAVMTAGYAFAMQDDEAYKNATEMERASSFFLPIPGVGTLRVPIPYELGFLGKSLPELAFNTAFGDTKLRDARSTLEKLVQATSPFDLPLAVKPIYELRANHSFYTDAPIEAAREQALQSSERYRTYTPELIKLLGLGPLSPLQVEHLVRSYTGGVGMLVMTIPDILLRPLRAPEGVETPARRLSELPMLSSLFQPETGRGIIDSVYKDIEGYQQAANTYKTLRGQDAADFANKYANEIGMASVGGGFRQKMGELAQVRRQITAAPNISAEDKQKYIEEIKKLEIQLANQIRQVAASMERR